MTIVTLTARRSCDELTVNALATLGIPSSGNLDYQRRGLPVIMPKISWAEETSDQLLIGADIKPVSQHKLRARSLIGPRERIEPPGQSSSAEALDLRRQACYATSPAMTSYRSLFLYYYLGDSRLSMNRQSSDRCCDTESQSA